MGGGGGTGRKEEALGNKKYQNFQVTLPDGTSCTLGLKQMAKGDTDSTMAAFEERMKGLASALDRNDNADEIYNTLVCSIKSTMTDQGPAMPQFSSKVECLRN